MRDPELVLCAQRAAARLEDAWDRWRTSRGPHEGSAGEVSSYVGYSQKEPRGRPRVVVGVDADEAELLAALLDSGCAQRAPAEEAANNGAHQQVNESRQQAADASQDVVVREPVNGVGQDTAVVREKASAVGQDAAVVRQPVNGVRQDVVVVREPASEVRQEAAEPQPCEICGALHTEDGTSEPQSAVTEQAPARKPAARAPAAEPQALPAPLVPAQPGAAPGATGPTGTAPLVPPQPGPAPGAPGPTGTAPLVPVQPGPALAVPAQAVPAPAARARSFSAQSITVYPAAAYPVPGMAAVGPAAQGQGPARDSAEPGEAGAAASDADATEPGGGPEPRAGASQDGEAGKQGAQAEPDDEGADEWVTGSIPAELSGWATAALPNQSHGGLAAWVAACSEPDEEDSGSLPRSA